MFVLCNIVWYIYNILCLCRLVLLLSVVVKANVLNLSVYHRTSLGWTNKQMQRIRGMERLQNHTYSMEQNW